ncbi:MAG: hypothetical protein Q9168_005535 [Polycauliona sp. 1 TL-2023]
MLTLGFITDWPVQEIAYESIPVQPMPSDTPWMTHIPYPSFDGPAYPIFTHLAALIAVVIFCFSLCKLSQYCKICPTPQAAFEEEIARKDDELASAKALNNNYAEIIDSAKRKRALQRAELKGLTTELQWFSVNYPLLETANVELQAQTDQASRHLEDTQDELDEWRKEASSLKTRLTKLTADRPIDSTSRTPTIGKRSAGGARDHADSGIQLGAVNSQMQQAVANKIKAETERDQARHNEKKAAEESSRKAASLEAFTKSSEKAKLESQTIIEELRSKLEDRDNKVTNLDSEKERRDKALEASIAETEMLNSTVCRLEKELKETKDDAKKTANATGSSLEKDSLLQARDTTIERLEGKLKALEAVEVTLKDLETKYVADSTDWENSNKQYKADIQNLQASLEACTTQHENATSEYHQIHQANQNTIQTITKNFEMAKKCHMQSAEHVKHLKRVLESAMQGLRITGNLDHPDSLEITRQHLEHNLRNYAGYGKLIHEVMRLVGIDGGIGNVNSLETIYQQFQKIFETMKLSPKVIQSNMMELTMLRDFKARILEIQSGEQSDDPKVQLRQAQGKIQALGQEVLLARKTASEARNKMAKFKSEKEDIDKSKKAIDKASEANKAKLGKLEDQLKEAIEKPESQKNTVSKQVESLEGQVKVLKKEKQDLKSHKKKLWERCNRLEESQSPGQQSAGAEKRGHSNGDEDNPDEELARSSKQIKREFVGGGQEA